jgi:hypothetical protein
MGYLHDSDGYAGLGSCSPSCNCTSCKQSSLSEYYYEGEGRDSPRDGKMSGYGESPGISTRTFKVVAKSYIAPIGLRAGSPPCGGFINPGADVRLRALALATDAAYSEDPRTDAKDKRCRLYSSRSFTVTCNGGNLVSVVPSAIDTDAGTECIPRTSMCLQPPPLLVSGVSAAQTAPTTYEFSWLARGRPHLGAEPAFQAVCPRTSVYIWHRVRGRIECAGGTPRLTLSLTGSAFPSHRAFVDGVIAAPTIPQGPFSNLWQAAGLRDPLVVR